MMGAQLLRKFFDKLQQATRRPNTYKVRTVNGREDMRLGGGYNFVFFGDWWQLAPITDTPLFNPPQPETPLHIKSMLDIFWSNSHNSIQRTWELTEQLRCEDTWYHKVLQECRMGALSEEQYNFNLRFSDS